MNPKDHAESILLLAEVDATTERTAAYDTATASGSWASLTITLSPGLTTDAVAPTISLLESDDTVVSNHATITADKTISVGAAAGTTQAIQRYEIDLRGRKRYLRLVVTPGTVASDDAVSVHASGRISHMRSGPSSTTEMVDGSNTSITESVVVV